MSKIQAKPYIEKVVATLSEEQKTSLLSLINGSNQTPAFRSLVNANNLITGADKGVSHIVLETWNKTYTGYLLYTDTYCVLVAYSNNTQELNIVKINLANRTYNLVKEVLTILEFRYIVGGSSGVGVDVTVDEINSGSTTAGKVIVADGEGGAEWGTAGMENPMTTAGDIIVGGTSGTPTRLAQGTQGQVLKVGASGLEWATDSDSELPALAGNGGKVLAVNSGATGTEWVDKYPTVSIALSQVVSQDPLTVQLTNDQYNVFANNKQVIMDMTALDPTLPIVVWQYAAEDSDYIYFGFANTTISNTFSQIQIDKSTKEAEYNFGEKAVDMQSIENGVAGFLLGFDSNDRGIATRNLPILTTAPSSANTEGGIIIVVLSSEPATYYDGYLYLIQDSQV